MKTIKRNTEDNEFKHTQFAVIGVIKKAYKSFLLLGNSTNTKNQPSGLHHFLGHLKEVECSRALSNEHREKNTLRWYLTSKNWMSFVAICNIEWMKKKSEENSGIIESWLIRIVTSALQQKLVLLSRLRLQLHIILEREKPQTFLHLTLFPVLSSFAYRSGWQIKGYKFTAPTIILEFDLPPQ